MHEEKETWDYTIEGHSSLFDVRISEIWRYKDLLFLFVKRDFISFYKQTILGPFWFFLQPLFTTIVFTFVFGNLAGISTDGLPQPLFYLAGITAWNYFADCLNKTSTVFKDNTSIFSKVYFPRVILPLSIVISNLIRFGVQMLLFIALMIFFHFQGKSFFPQWTLILFPLLVLLMAILGLSIGMIITALTTKYRDLSFLVQFGVQLLMYGTTVIYPLSSLSEKYKYVVELNPMTSIIETFRYSFLGKGEFSMSSLGYTCVFTLITFILGLVIFNRTEKTFVDTV